MRPGECSLCAAQSVPGAVLTFRAVERVEQRRPVAYDAALGMCQGCANRLIKHLKRAIPRRLMVQR